MATSLRNHGHFQSRATPRRFGRIYIRDERDDKFPITVKRASKRTSRYWNQSGWWGDQLATPKCVGYAFAHWVEDGPVTHDGKPPVADPTVIYDTAQDLDEWEGDDYEGTSIRGGVKALKAMGYVSEYRWTKSLRTLVNTILEVGPVVVGTVWWSGMFEPNKSGLVRARGEAVGGHAYVLNGVNTKRKLFRIKNSWGRFWGLNGCAYIGFDDLGMLIEDMDGECCLASEIPDARGEA